MAWSADRARCIFSVSLNESTLHVSPGAAPGNGAGLDDGRAGIRPLLRAVERTGLLLRSVLDDLVTTTFPSDCRVCGEPLLRATSLPICDQCRVATEAQTSALCRCCGEALEMEDVRITPAEGLLCFPCRAVQPMFERAVAYAVYEDELREMIHLLKYERMGGVSKLLGGMLAESILTLRAETARDLVVVAVPLYPAKQRQRGYNQAELLADAAIAELRAREPEWKLRRLSGLLARRRDTQSQFELTPRGRRRNLEGAFEIDAAKLPIGCEVLLIDDIYTTGATARECARVLRRAGAHKVWVATLARAQRPAIAMWDASSMHAAQGFG
ncbi:MAG: ComF family protein [Acidobacteriota bacterium]|nr:ComF family protein [Acidobacteriota bacterium]